ncbi:MAG: J domain-containing protein [Xanthobacteraceae bacterium]
MIEWIGLQQFLSPALVDAAWFAAWFASWTILPVLLLGCVRQWFVARRMRPEFWLRRSEAAELERAVAVYRKVCARLNEIEDCGCEPGWLWRAVFAARRDADSHRTDERDDLDAHASHLHATIVRLRRLPLRRLKAWVRATSLRAALGRAVAVYLTAFTLSALAFCLLGAAAGRLLPALLAASLFPANAAGAGFAVLSLPAFYLRRRALLRRELALEFCVLKELAETAPGQRIDRPENSIRVEPAADRCCFTTLGIGRSASLDEVREAYRALIQQSHPDRVQNMSAAIRNFAETETKRINAAYEEALACLA